MIRKELVCDVCGHDVLISIGLMGKWDGVMNVGGPGQAPNIMPGIRFAAYLCPNCGFIGPWKKYYTANPTLNNEYKALLEECKAAHKEKSPIGLKSQLDKLKGFMDAEKTLSRTLPGPTMDDNLDRVVSPLKEEIEALRDEIRALKGEIQKRKGGRPRKS